MQLPFYDCLFFAAGVAFSIISNVEPNQNMPITANHALRNRKDVNGQIIKQTPTCKVSHGLGRRTSLTGFSQKVRNDQNYKLREEGSTTWLNCNGQNIAVQKKHIKNLGIDVHNFYGGPVMKNRPKLAPLQSNIYFDQFESKSSDKRHESKLRNETIAPESDTNNMGTQQQQPNKIYCLVNKVPKWEILMNPAIVRPIDKFILDKLRKCPRRSRQSKNSRIQKRNERKLSRPFSSRTNRRSVERMPEENVEYDNITLCNFGDIRPRNYPEEDDSEKCYSSDPDSDDTVTESIYIDDINIFSSEKDDISLEGEFLPAAYKKPKYNTKLVCSDTFTSEKEEFHSRRNSGIANFLEGEGALLPEKGITLEDKDDSDIFSSEVEVQSQGHTASELTIYSEEDKPLLAENYFTLDYKDLQNYAKYGIGGEVIHRRSYEINLTVTIPRWAHRDHMKLLFSCFKQLKKKFDLTWMERKGCIFVLLTNPCSAHCDASYLLYVYCGLGNPALIVRIKISFLPDDRGEKTPSPYLEILPFILERTHLKQLTQMEMEFDRFNKIYLIKANRLKQLINNIKRMQILLASYRPVEKKKFKRKIKKRKNQPTIQINALLIISSVILISGFFLVFHELYYRRPKPLTFWQSFLLCFGI